VGLGEKRNLPKEKWIHADELRAVIFDDSAHKKKGEDQLKQQAIFAHE